MMKKFLSVVARSLIGFALICVGASVSRARNVNVRATQKRQHLVASRAQRKSPAQKTKPVAADALPAKPTVRAVKEAELKTLLGASATQGRPLLVNFWATWCEPCKAEFPDLVKLDGQYHARGLDFNIISLDDMSDIAKGVPEFLQTMRAARMPAYLLHADDQDAAINLVDPAWRGELPATFLYDRQGKLAYTHKGRIKVDELQAAIEKLLNTK